MGLWHRRYDLTQVTQASTTTESYSYDPVGNRTASLGVSSYTTNSSNEMTANSNASYTYDANGNTTSKTAGSDTTSYAWDYENRLTSVTLPGSAGTVSFKYDPFGRRIEKISPTTTSIFVYDGNNLVETVNASGSEVASYAQSQNIDEPLAMDRSGTVDYYEQDGLGSVTSLTNATGTVAQSYAYDSFGNTTNSSGSLTNFFRYTGREFDVETNLYYYRARYYDSGAGRFLNEDPIRFSADVDFYRYAFNNPQVLRDPTGNLAIGVIVGGVAGGLQGGIGAAIAGGDAKQIIISTIVGAASGAFVGLLDPTDGVMTVGEMAVIGGFSGGLGDLTGQVLSGRGTVCDPINWGEFAGGIMGGALSAVGGAVLGAGAEALNLSEAGAAAAGAAITSPMVVLPPLIGAQAGGSH